MPATKYGHFEQITRRIGCIPLKVEQWGVRPYHRKTAFSLNAGEIDMGKFEIPDFRVREQNPYSQ